MTTGATEHSPLGASSAERWSKCPGSVALLSHLQLPSSDEPDYRAEGTAAHSAAAYALSTPGMDAWELIGTEFHGVKVDQKMANAVQVYLDVCRADEDNGLQFGVEERVSFPEHEKGFGTVDHWVCKSDMDNPGARMLSVNDYKNGMLLVEADSVQFKYYAFCLLHHPDLKHVVRVRLRVIQPNGFHSDGPVREYWTTREEIMDWGRTVLVPAMERTALDNALDAGSWCRFCPAKLVCPMLTGLFGAAAKCNPQDVVNLSEESLAREYEQLQAVGFYTKALKDEALRRMMLGHTIPGIKLVPQRANRVWKDGAKEVLLARFGQDCYEPPEFKSPPGVENLGAEAVPLVREWAFIPQTGLTIVPESDPKPGVKIEKASQAFAGVENASG